MPVYTPPPVDQSPDFIRLPGYGQREPRTNLSRSALDLLIRPQKANAKNESRKGCLGYAVVIRDEVTQRPDRLWLYRTFELFWARQALGTLFDAQDRQVLGRRELWRPYNALSCTEVASRIESLLNPVSRHPRRKDSLQEAHSNGKGHPTRDTEPASPVDYSSATIIRHEVKEVRA